MLTVTWLTLASLFFARASRIDELLEAPEKLPKPENMLWYFSDDDISLQNLQAVEIQLEVTTIHASIFDDALGPNQDNTQIIIGHGEGGTLQPSKLMNRHKQPKQHDAVALAAAILKSWKGGVKPDYVVLMVCESAQEQKGGKKSVAQLLATALKTKVAAPMDPVGTPWTDYKVDSKVVRVKGYTDATPTQWTLFYPDAKPQVLVKKGLLASIFK